MAGGIMANGEVQISRKHDGEVYWELIIGGVEYRLEDANRHEASLQSALDSYAADDTSTDLVNHAGVTAV